MKVHCTSTLGDVCRHNCTRTTCKILKGLGLSTIWVRNYCASMFFLHVFFLILGLAFEIWPFSMLNTNANQYTCITIQTCFPSSIKVVIQISDTMILKNKIEKLKILYTLHATPFLKYEKEKWKTICKLIIQCMEMVVIGVCYIFLSFESRFSSLNINLRVSS